MRQGKKRNAEKNRKPGEKPQPDPIYRTLPCILTDGGLGLPGEYVVPEELPVALFINGRHAITVMMSPVNPEDFITGYLFTEEIIRSLKEIESIRIEKNRVSVITKNLFQVQPKKTILSGCGGSTSFIDTEKLPRIRSDFSLSASVILAALQAASDMDNQRINGAVSRAVLHDSQGMIGTAEDIGRLNAVDRILGYALRNGIFLSQTFVITSGCIYSEMVRKCLTANIPVLVSCSGTTALAVELADTTGMTVIGSTCDGKLNIFSHPERIT